ncbi:MAG: hypothetical protein V8R51_05120 [Clostridia bacterium]
MKKRIIIFILTGIILTMSACSNSTSTNSSQADNQKIEQQENDKNNVDQKEENKEATAQERIQMKSQRILFQMRISHKKSTLM